MYFFEIRFSFFGFGDLCNFEFYRQTSAAFRCRSRFGDSLEFVHFVVFVRQTLK